MGVVTPAAKHARDEAKHVDSPTHSNEGLDEYYVERPALLAKLWQAAQRGQVLVRYVAMSCRCRGISLCLLRAPPASGKTTTAQALANSAVQGRFKKVELFDCLHLTSASAKKSFLEEAKVWVTDSTLMVVVDEAQMLYSGFDEFWQAVKGRPKCGFVFFAGYGETAGAGPATPVDFPSAFGGQDLALTLEATVELAAKLTAGVAWWSRDHAVELHRITGGHAGLVKWVLCTVLPNTLLANDSLTPGFTPFEADEEVTAARFAMAFSRPVVRTDVRRCRAFRGLEGAEPNPVFRDLLTEVKSRLDDFSGSDRNVAVKLMQDGVLVRVRACARLRRLCWHADLSVRAAP